MEISDKPLDGDTVTLSALPDKLNALGIKLYSDAGEYLENSYLAISSSRTPTATPTGEWILSPARPDCPR